MSTPALAPRAILIILDGWGLGADPAVDAIAQANTPCFDGLVRHYPHATLVTYGEEVGLPEGQMGNSEVGHLNIGAGRVVYQELARINKEVREHKLHVNPVLLECFAFAKTRHADTGAPRTLHLMGLVSDGGVHSHVNHLLALCDAAAEAGVARVRIHAFTDGRDTAPHAGLGYLTQVQHHIAGTDARLATVTGRYYAMDRDHRWERVQLAYDALVKGDGQRTTEPLSVLRARYEDGQTDEFITPIVCTDGAGEPIGAMRDGDAVVFFNFRTDRPREITQVLTQPTPPVATMSPLALHFVTMTRYDESFEGLHVIYTKDDLVDTMGEVLAKAGKTQLRIAETEKYPHVTFFFNGGREEAFAHEDRIIVPSPQVATYDLQPEMSAFELRDQLVSRLQTTTPDVVTVNFANTDMVGHTGILAAAVAAAEAVDACLRVVVEEAQRLGYALVVIADHGNADIMAKPDGSPHTAHTTNPVPVIYVPAPGAVAYPLRDGKLADVAPTLLELVGVAPSPLMDGASLLRR